MVASSLDHLLWTSMESTVVGGDINKMSFLEQQEMRMVESHVKSSTRRNKSGKVVPKKPPQRGLGVAQLERLRLQERWKKISDFDQLQQLVLNPSESQSLSSPSSQSQSQSQNFNQFHHQFPFQEQQNIVSVHPIPRFAASHQMMNNYGAAGTAVTNINGGQQISQCYPFVFNPYNNRVGNGGFINGNVNSGIRSVFSDHQFETDRLRVLISQSENHHPLMETTSKELSSSQKAHCLSDNCDICLKKKRMINGENLGFDGGKMQYTERKPFDGCDFLGLDLGRNYTINGQTQKGDRRACYPGIPVDEEVEVVAVHRKGKSSLGRGGGAGSSTTTVLMEYEFFPRKASNIRSVKKEPLFGEAVSSSSVVVGESSSSSAAAATNNSNTNLIDLSLKLSC